ncbi:right-handed parallel beta-helix repeat-containing protein [Mammaliicoccus sciuri]|uniref:right-handed parallel beta-helix repeat-containing protein n=1 Tax=Mammaliicoccus sciuri TaxID=1296 RepID=UPI001FB1F0BF|nr:right-handed parallel beta-helix repeat-containing protein [Mammaliicoccus sciuri]MCJ0907693.1 right-handed parallel beta-helix repeat-containing protein [Mammaliicoccus sciuri]
MKTYPSLRVQKNLSNKLDQASRREHIENYTKIEKAFNDVLSRDYNHRTDEQKAHSTKQITHGNTTLDKLLTYRLAQIENLVTGVDGDGVKEVTDSRVSTDGTSHELLSERLLHDFNNVSETIDNVNKKFVEINFDTYNPDKSGQVPVNTLLQSALNEIRDADAGTLIIKNGVYLINKRVTVHSNTTIKMEDNAVLLRGNDRAILDFGNINEMFYGYDGVQNIHLIGGTLDCNLEEINKYPTDAANTINIRHAQNVSFYNVKFRNTLSYHAVDINGVKDIYFTNCIFEGYKNLNGTSGKEAIQIAEIVKGGVGGPGAWDGTPCKNVVITGCVFRASNIAPSFDVAIGNHASIHNVYQENIRITNNIFEECKVGVYPFKWVNVEISGNTFDKNSTCVRIAATRGNTNSAKDVNGIPSKQSQGGDIYLIKDNVFRNYKNYGVYAYGEEYNDSIGYIGHIRINDNTFTCDNNDNGKNIVMALCRHVHIKGNNMTYSYRGIYITGSHNIFIDNNYIENIKTEGIFVNDSAYSGFAMQTNHLNITNNTINSTGRNCMNIHNSRFLYINNNKTLNANLQTEDSVNRGGIFLTDCRNGRIESNDNWGVTDSFAIYGTKLTNVVAFNNGGSGTVRLTGTDAYVGYYNVDSNNNIIKHSTKG